VSLVVAALAFLVAVYAGYQSKRSASATEKQASVASEQLEQGERASYQAVQAAKETKAVTWHDISDRLMERTVKVVIGVEEIQCPPILARNILDESEYPRSAQPDQPTTLNSKSFNDRYSLLYYWVRGIIVNEDSRSIQFIPLGVRLTEGTTSLIDGEFKIPPKMHPREGRYLLAPGKAALFEWRASLTVDQWIEVFNESEEARVLSVGIFAYPAGDPDTASYTRIVLEDGCPLVNYRTGDNEWEIIEDPPVCAYVKPPRLVRPKALTQLLLSLDGSGESSKDPSTWNLDPWQRDMLDLW
jgi:hypothetical protein